MAMLTCSGCISLHYKRNAHLGAFEKVKQWILIEKESVCLRSKSYVVAIVRNQSRQI